MEADTVDVPASEQQGLASVAVHRVRTLDNAVSPVQTCIHACYEASLLLAWHAWQIFFGFQHIVAQMHFGEALQLLSESIRQSTTPYAAYSSGLLRFEVGVMTG